MRQIEFKLSIWVQLVIVFLLVLISIGCLGYLISRIKFGILGHSNLGSETELSVLPFSW